MKRGLALALIVGMLLCHTSIAFALEETPSGVLFNDLESFIDDYVAKYIGETSPGLAVVLVKDDEIVFSKGYGYSDLEKGIHVNPETTLFEYGSISKLFVYTAVMQLVEDGILNLNEDIRTYLPEGFLRSLRYDDPITLLHLMNHTAGFEDHLFDVVVTSGVHQSFENTLMHNQPEQIYQPGTITAYSNYGVALAAYIVQSMVDQEFHEYITREIFLPSEMMMTFSHPDLNEKSVVVDNKANGYRPIGNGQFRIGRWSYLPLYPVGGVNGTAEDLARFAKALMPTESEKSVLFNERETLNQMLSQSHAMGPGLSGFAHGFIEFDGLFRAVGHGGNTAYFTAQMNIVPEKRFGVIILSNAANEMDLTLGLTNALLGENLDQKPLYKGVLPDVEQVTGVYISARRPYNSFLKLYGFLSPLKVNKTGADTIEISYAGQAGQFKQIAPFLYKRVEAEGAIFRYHFDFVYFQMEDGVVKRVSGDFVPLPPGYSQGRLLLDGMIAVASTLFFLLTFIGVLMKKIIHKIKKSKKLVSEGKINSVCLIYLLPMVFLISNNVALIGRMLINHFRSFSEFKPQILLNYPLGMVSLAIGVVALAYSIKKDMPKRHSLFYTGSLIMMAAFMMVLFRWGFFDLL